MNKSDATQGRDQSFIKRARRAQIIEAAIAVIAELGYHKASFARIAKHARISPGLISYHFGDKDDLVHEVVRHVTAAMESALEEHVRGVSSYREALRRIIDGQVRFFATRPAETLAYGAIRSNARNAEGGLRFAASERERSLGRLRDFFKAGQNAGEFRAFDARWMALSLLAALEAVPGEFQARADTDKSAYAAELATTFDLATRAS